MHLLKHDALLAIGDTVQFQGKPAIIQRADQKSGFIYVTIGGNTVRVFPREIGALWSH